MELNEKFKLYLKESPYLFPTRKDLKYLSNLSANAIRTRFRFLGGVENRPIDVYENKENGSILAGTMIGEEFYIIITITCEERSLYVKAMQLSHNRKHVKLVLVSKEVSGNSVAKDVYALVARQFDIVSDRLQYLGAMDLWKSLTRIDDLNIYVFDENKKDYLRDDKGDIIKYNGTNIEDDDIWGSEEKHQDRLLVATVRTLE